jgi:hypothetical protein
MQREKRLTKRERKALAPKKPVPAAQSNTHIHCTACGKHLDPSQFQAPATAVRVACQHGSKFASCVECVPATKRLLAEHDRTGQQVQAAGAWH